MQSSTGDPWEDEGFGGEDDWEGRESLEADLEDDEAEDDLELEVGELDDDGEVTEL